MKKILDIFSNKKEKVLKRGKIEIDHREKNSGVPAELMGMGFEVAWKQLPVGDYIVNGVVIERKTVSDFKSSIVNKRIIGQLLELKQFDKSFLIVEGIIDEDVYSGGIHENAFRGFLLSVVLDYGIGIVFTHDFKDSAKYIDVLARRKEKGELGIRPGKILMSDGEQVQFILEGFPNIGAVKAKGLIEKFGSLEKIFGASVEELEEVLGKKAKEFRELITTKIK